MQHQKHGAAELAAEENHGDRVREAACQRYDLEGGEDVETAVKTDEYREGQK